MIAMRIALLFLYGLLFACAPSAPPGLVWWPEARSIRPQAEPVSEVWGSWKDLRSVRFFCPKVKWPALEARIREVERLPGLGHWSANRTSLNAENSDLQLLTNLLQIAGRVNMIKGPIEVSPLRSFPRERRLYTLVLNDVAFADALVCYLLVTDRHVTFVDGPAGHLLIK
jgi:hypothetical protein